MNPHSHQQPPHHQQQIPLSSATGGSSSSVLVNNNNNNNNYMIHQNAVSANNGSMPNTSSYMMTNNNNNMLNNNHHHSYPQQQQQSMMNRHMDYDHNMQYYSQRSQQHPSSAQQNFTGNGESQPNLSSTNLHPSQHQHVGEHVFTSSSPNVIITNNNNSMQSNNNYVPMQKVVINNNQYSSNSPPSSSFQYNTQHQTNSFKQPSSMINQQQQQHHYSNYTNNSLYQPQQQHNIQPPQQTYPTTTYSNANYSANIPQSNSSGNMSTNQSINNHQQHSYNNYEIATSFASSPSPPMQQPQQQSQSTTFNPSIVSSNMQTLTDSPTTKKQKRKKSLGSENADVNGYSQETTLAEHGHPIACVQCRSRHKKCDRTLPSCLNCTKRGVECTYRSPKMKGRKDQKFHPYSSLLYIPPATSVPLNNSSSTQPKPKKQKKDQNVINQIVDSHFTAQWDQHTPNQQTQNQTQQSIEEPNNNFNPITVSNQLENQLQLVMTQNATNFNNDTFSTLLTSLSSSDSSSSKENEENEKALAIIESLQNNQMFQTPRIDREFLLNLSKDSISDLLGSLGVSQNNFPQNIKLSDVISHDLIRDAEIHQRLNMNAYKKRTVELYDEVISMGYPLLSKSTLESAFFNEESMRGIYSNDVLALLYAIHAVTCQAFGVHDEANIGFQKSRTLLTESFDNSQNLFVAGTYCHFARYCSGIGDKGKAKFYLNYVDLFFRKRNKNFKNKTHLNYSIEDENKSGENFSIFNGLPVDDLHLLKYRVLCGISVDKSGEFFLDDSSNFPGFTFGSYVSKIICDGCLYAIGKIPNTIMSIMTQKVSLENLNLYAMLVEFSANFLTIHEDERNISETTRSCMKCLHQLFYHGCNVQLYKEAGVTDERIENEAKLFTLTTASGPFHLVQPLTLGALFETATIHLKILDEIEQGKRSFDQLTQTYQLIELDNRALEIVRTKNKELIDRTCKHLLEKLQFRTRQFTSLPFYNQCSMTALIKDNFEIRRCSPVVQDKFNDAITILMEELNK